MTQRFLIVAGLLFFLLVGAFSFYLFFNAEPAHEPLRGQAAERVFSLENLLP